MPESTSPPDRAASQPGRPPREAGRDFHFSPRPNRANEIKWRPWSEKAFGEAASLDRPILLSISAVWCHWCHVMDETTYSNAGVIDLINREYLPIRVDNDLRADVNQRYNMGGWPTTAFLTSSGELLTGATYLPPDQMADALSKVAGYYHSNQPEIANRVLEAKKRAGALVARSAGALDLSSQFNLYLRRLGMVNDSILFEGKVALRIEQARHLVRRAYWPPSETRPFTIECQVDS